MSQFLLRSLKKINAFQMSLKVGSRVTISKSVQKFFFYIFLKFEHFKGLTLNLRSDYLTGGRSCSVVVI